MKKTLTYTFAFLFLVSISSFAQDNNETLPLNEQFNQMVDKAETYNEYKVIKSTRLNQFWGVVTDSVSQLKSEIGDLKQTIITQQTEIDNLKTQMAEFQAESEEAIFDSTHIRFLGIDFDKAAFIIGMIAIIFILASIIGIGYYQYKKNKVVAAQKVRDYEKLSHEFEDHKKTAFDKQIKLKRELQTERNKLEELRNKGSKSNKVTV